MLNDEITRRLLMSGSMIGAGVGASLLAGSTAAAQSIGAGPARTEAGRRPGQPNAHGLFYRDLDGRGRAISLQTLLDRDRFISAHRFFSEEEIADATGYRGRMDHTAQLQAALDAAWSTNRDLFLPAGLYRVRGLRLPGGQAERNRAFRFYGQGSGELFARAETGGTIVKGIGGGSVLFNRQDLPRTGNGNQEIAYIRFEGDSDDPVIDLATLYTQSELHHCGIYQAGRGDGLRVRMAATGEIHHNYVVNRDWKGDQEVRRTGTGLAISSSLNTGLVALRKNTSRGFRTGYSLGAGGEGVMLAARIEHCEVSVCENGMLLSPLVRGAVVEHGYFEGGRGGTAIRDEGHSNTLTNNYIFPGFARHIHLTDTSRGARVQNNTLSAGSAQTVAAGGCTLLTVDGPTAGMVATGNELICDPVSSGPIGNVVGMRFAGPIDGAQLWPNAFLPAAPWDFAVGSRQFESPGLARGIVGGESNGPRIAGAALALERHPIDRIEGGSLDLDGGSWFDYTGRSTAVLRSLSAGQDGGVVILTDRGGRLTVESSTRIRLADGAGFTGPGTLTLLTIVENGQVEAVELSRSRY